MIYFTVNFSLKKFLRIVQKIFHKEIFLFSFTKLKILKMILYEMIKKLLHHIEIELFLFSTTNFFYS